MHDSTDAQSAIDFSKYREEFPKRLPDYDNIKICHPYKNAVSGTKCTIFSCPYLTNREACTFKSDNKNQCSELEFLKYHTEINLEKPDNTTNLMQGSPPLSKDKVGRNCYLWVVKDGDIPSILENSPEFLSEHNQIPKHSNLTGGQEAYCGGELWKLDDHRYVISGSSGRYRVRSANELNIIKQAFTSLGYTIDTLGWDYEAPNGGWAKKYDEDGRFQ